MNRPLTDHHSTCESGAVEQAARYLAETLHHDRPAPLVPALRAMFGLTSAEVCAAIRHSQDLKAKEGADDAERP